MLQDSLGGNSKTYLVATINPSLACSDESVSTLRFADRAHQVSAAKYRKQRHIYFSTKSQINLETSIRQGHDLCSGE